MEDKVKIKLKGEVTILINGEQVYQDHNDIDPGSIACILYGLVAVPTNYNVDTIVFSGDFDSVHKTVSDTQVNIDEKSVTFITQALEEDFTGTVSELLLNMSQVDQTMATRYGLSIEKNDATRLEVRWKIFIDNCS